ncbi:MAG: trigger factor [Parasporobacterium sp.]|nr:trigger factor [Parasporobacterium sp.]
MENNTTKKSKGSAYSQPDHIKAKSKWTKKTTIWVIVCAVIVLGILAIIGGSNGWFKTKDMINGKATLDDYSVIEIADTDVEVTDLQVQSYLDSVISAETTYEDVTEGTVADGDTINLDYSGVLEGEEEPFDGGTAQGQSLTIGSGTMIDGFESQIIGHEAGETFDIDVTFPEDYSTEDLAGKNATFTVTVNSIHVAHVPEMTDELVKQYSEANLDETFNTVEELEDYYKERTYNNRLESAIVSRMLDKTHVKYYNEADLAALTNYNTSAVNYYGSMFGVDGATYASMMGYDSVAAYAEEESKELLNQTMMYDIVAEEQNITVSDEEIDEALTGYMESEGFSGTLEEFKAQSGDAYLFLIRETEVLGPKVLDYLKQNVTIIETPKEEASEEVSEAVEDAIEEVSETAEEVVEEASEAVEEAVEEVSDTSK